MASSTPIILLILKFTCVYRLVHCQGMSEEKILSGMKSNLTANQNSTLDDVNLFKHIDRHSFSARINGRLRIDISDVTTSSIHVNWNLPFKEFDDSVIESNVICETPSGFMLSNKQVASTGSYKLENLHSNTSYIICVYMVEKSEISSKTLLHFSCLPSKTDELIHIPTLRTDSIVAVILTLGYVVIMIVIGYLTWKWKIKQREQDEAKQRLTIEDEDYYCENCDTNNVDIHTEYADDNFETAVSGSYAYSVSGDDFDNEKYDSDYQRSGDISNNVQTRKQNISKKDNLSTVKFSKSDVELQRKSNSVDGVNGRYPDWKMASVPEISESRNEKTDKRSPTKKSIEDSPVKVTEITF